MAEGKVWTIVKILEWTINFFTEKGLESPRLDAEFLLCDILKCERITLYVNFDQPLKEEELIRYKKYIVRRANYEPLAYIIGYKYFMNYKLKVTEDTLVPRPETEILVEHLNKTLKVNKEPLKILDIGTGSGAIICSLLDLLPNAQGVAVDISEGALEVATTNANDLGVGDRFTAVVSDLFTNLAKNKAEGLFDLVVSNPPYIAREVLKTLAKDVQKEPQNALDGGEDGLEFYRNIIKDVKKYLKPEGVLAFEIGFDQGKDVKELCEKAGFEVVVIAKDYAHLDRMVFATMKGSAYEDKVMEIR